VAEKASCLADHVCRYDQPFTSVTTVYTVGLRSVESAMAGCSARWARAPPRV
jgi:hypothetical protein